MARGFGKTFFKSWAATGNLDNHEYPDTSDLKKLSRLVTYSYCISIPDLYLNCHKGEPASFQSKCNPNQLAHCIPIGVVTMDSKLKNNREIRCPPFFMQGDDVIYDYLIQDCFLWKRTYNKIKNKQLHKKKWCAVSVIQYKYLFPDNALCKVITVSLNAVISILWW